jgi:hypothetical protein
MAEQRLRPRSPTSTSPRSSSLDASGSGARCARGRRGELRPGLDVELVLHLLTGPMLTRTMIHPPGPEGISPDFAARIVDTVLEGIAARP